MTPNFHIIGAGVSGLSVALALLLRGYQVTVLERGRAGGESSWAGGGILFPLLPWEYSDAMNALAFRSITIYRDWLGRAEVAAGLDAEYWQCGMLVLDTNARGQAVAWCRDRCLIVDPIQHSPVLTVATDHDLSNALYLPHVAQVRNPRLINVLVTAITHLGGQIHEHCHVTGFTMAGRQINGIQSSICEWKTENVILTTGAWSGIQSDGISPAPNIYPIRGQMLLFKLSPGVLNTIIYRNGLYLIPRRDGHVLVGSTLEDVGFDKSTDMATRQRLHAEAAELLPIINTVQPIQHWAGLRPGSPDNIPIIDRHPDFENVFINTGHYRYGVTMAPASAELLVDQMEGKTPALDPEPYSWQAALARSWGDEL